MKKKLIIIVGVIFVIFAVRFFGLQEYLTLDYLKANLDNFKEYYASNQGLTLGIFFAIYVLTTALSIPGATILTLAAGALFGLTVGTIFVSFASTTGATLAFLLSRYLLKDSVEKKFGNRIKSINEGIEKDGAFYLFSLRLLPIFPFFMVNLLMGLTKIKVWTYFFVSQVGMLAGTVVYVNAGKQVSELDSLAGILSLELIGSFSLIGLLPIVSKKIVESAKAKKVYKGYKKPESFDYNMVVIGAGAGGLVTSYITAAVKGKVALIEKHKMGGDCLNTGCVPSKAIIKSAKVFHQAKNLEKYGLIQNDVAKVDFAKVMDRVHNVIAKVEPHDSVERYEGLGVECISGTAKILSPWEVEVNGRVLTTKNITVATGGRPFVPPIKGLDQIEFLVSDNLWQLRELPKKFVVLGSGPIGMEMAQAFHRLGSEVTVVDRGDMIMRKEDRDVGEYVLKKLEEEGVNFKLESNPVEIVKGNEFHTLVLDKKDGSTEEITFDRILVATGRKANVAGFGLEELGVEITERGTLKVDEYLRTNFPNIFGCGDVIGTFQLTHTAAHEAWFAAVNGLFGRFKKFKVDYSVIPWATYTDPEVATVGHLEWQLKRDGIEYDVTKYGIDDLDRAIAESEDYGFVKVCTPKGSDKILGATIVGPRASDYAIEFIAGMKNGFGLNKILGTIHPYPTMAEANKYLAGEWKRASTNPKILEYLEKFMKWQRS